MRNMTIILPFPLYQQQPLASPSVSLSHTRQLCLLSPSFSLPPLSLSCSPAAIGSASWTILLRFALHFVDSFVNKRWKLAKYKYICACLLAVSHCAAPSPAPNCLVPSFSQSRSLLRLCLSVCLAVSLPLCVCVCNIYYNDNSFMLFIYKCEYK